MLDQCIFTRHTEQSEIRIRIRSVQTADSMALSIKMAFINSPLKANGRPLTRFFTGGGRVCTIVFDSSGIHCDVLCQNSIDIRVKYILIDQLCKPEELSGIPDLIGLLRIQLGWLIGITSGAEAVVIKAMRDFLSRKRVADRAVTASHSLVMVFIITPNLLHNTVIIIMIMERLSLINRTVSGIAAEELLSRSLKIQRPLIGERIALAHSQRGSFKECQTLTLGNGQILLQHDISGDGVPFIVRIGQRQDIVTPRKICVVEIADGQVVSIRKSIISIGRAGCTCQKQEAVILVGVGIGDVRHVVLAVLHGDDIPHMGAFITICIGGSRHRIAGHRPIEIGQVAEILKGLGIALADHLGGGILIEHPDQLPGVTVGR